MAVPNIVTGDFVRVRATAFLNGQVAVWGCDQRVAGMVAGGVSIVDFANLVVTIFDTQVPPTIANAAIATDAVVELLDGATGRVLQSALGFSGRPVGTGGANAMATQVAGVVRKLTGLAGPSKRGRMYWPFLPTAAVDANGEWTAGSQAAIAVATANMFGAQTYTAGASSISTVPCLLKSDPLPHAVTAFDITSFEPSAKLGTQKKRGDYGRANTSI